jgi:hypothetical protein
MRRIAPSSQRARPHVPENQFVTNNMVIVPHPPYSPDLAPRDCVLFHKLKMKLKGRRFETGSDIHGVLKLGNNDGIAVYVPKETILKTIAAKIELVKPAFIF